MQRNTLDQERILKSYGQTDLENSQKAWISGAACQPCSFSLSTGISSNPTQE